MPLNLTPDVLRAAYDYLNATRPFVRWNLPDGDDVVFRVVRTPNLYAWYERKRGRHLIAVSRSSVGHTPTLIETMAHEMIHLHEEANGAKTRGEHSAAFKRWAVQVCAVHGFDPKRF